jgi:carboxyl-terminal processing protease
MNKLAIAAAGGAVLGLVVTTQVAGPLIAQEAEGDRSIYEQLDLFGDIFERIRADYVEAADEGELMEAAINGMLTSLDPHSSYLSPEDAAKMRVQTQGEFGGLGLEVTQEEGWVKVVSPMDGTPADAAGLQTGDFITAVDGQTLMGFALDEAVELMRGPRGARIVLTIAGEGETRALRRVHHPRHIKLQAVRARTEGEHGGACA